MDNKKSTCNTWSPVSFLRRNIFVSILLLFMLMVTNVSAHPGSGIVIDQYGQVYITDTGQGVWKIDREGNLSSIPASRFHWMAIDEDACFSASSKSFGEWFERVTPQNSKPALIMSSDFPLTVHQDGNIYYADTRPNSTRIVRRTPEGRETVLARNKKFEHISGIAVGPDGSLYVTEGSNTGANTVQKITMDGKVSIVVSSIPSYCRGLVVDGQGFIYVAATGDRSVLRISPKGQITNLLQIQEPWSPTGVALFQGEVYVLEWHDVPPAQEEDRRAWIPRVRKIGLDGKVTTLATISRS